MKQSFFLIFLFCQIHLTAQIGGRFAFESSALPTNARLTALGGHLITVQDDDIALAQHNPSLLNEKSNFQLGINHNFNFAGISNGNVAFGKSFDSLGIYTHAAIQYVSYGDFQNTDAIGNINGTFSAGEVGVILGAAKQLNERIKAGVNLKFYNGNYESYSSLAAGIDIGFHYQKPGSNASWALVLKNMGAELNPIVDDKRGLPFELQLGFSKKLEHLPFRFSIIGQQLQKWYIRFDDPDVDNQVNIFGEVTVKSQTSKNVDNFFRHFVFNGEFLIGKQEQVRLRFGYNHLRKQELKVTNFRSLAGFSFGLGFNIKKIRFDYGLGFYHLAGATNHLSMRMDLSRMFKKI
ncbi:MAG: type IX secretion system protein PorQ [Saprospiraceae bacterium]|nr:type IX secretion system protein PorQ [Bacteroidia bacterium]NNE14882.1 type IX secretion system protein PorQ [Saprospiraceae bacterium]NNL93636.1 type IX secretion system protein PorQ [Saprospiraceae bacterium]